MTLFHRVQKNKKNQARKKPLGTASYIPKIIQTQHLRKIAITGPFREARWTNSKDPKKKRINCDKKDGKKEHLAYRSHPILSRAI